MRGLNCVCFCVVVASVVQGFRMSRTRSSSNMLKKEASNLTSKKKAASSPKTPPKSNKAQQGKKALQAPKKQQRKLKILSVAERTKLAERVLDLRKKKQFREIDKLAETHSNRTSLLRDAAQIKKGVDLQEIGRPKFFGGEVGASVLREGVKKLAKANKDRSGPALKQLIQEARLKASTAFQYKDPYKKPSKSTLSRFKKSVLKAASNHTKTTARVRAENSIRNFISWSATLAAMHQCVGGLHPRLFVAQDFSGVVFGEAGKMRQWVTQDWEEIDSLPVGVVRAEQRPVAILYQATMTAAGTTAPFLIYAKAPQMKDAEQLRMKLPGVGSTTHNDEYAWLVVDNKRKVCCSLRHKKQHHL